MSIDEALDRACADAGIKPPRQQVHGRWIVTDTLSGRNGKGDGRVIIDHNRVTAWNWQTGEKVTVWTDDRPRTAVERRRIAEDIEQERRERQQLARRAHDMTVRLIGASQQTTHPYLISKGFPEERALVIPASGVRSIAGDYLVAGLKAIVVPARINGRVTSAQLIWEDGTKKFLYGGLIGGASHRLATGNVTWLCEGYATGLSLRAALRGLHRADGILVCFSASNVATVAGGLKGLRFVAADHDAPPRSKPDQFGGLGAGEHFARMAKLPYVMPPTVSTDFNDLHADAGLFAVQRQLTTFLRRAA